MQNKVFISYKNTIDGIKTEDARMAKELYSALSNAGIPCFFSEKTLEEFGEDKFKERIDYELDRCQILIVVGTSLANINSRWVKYEWSSFSMDILQGRKMGRIFSYVDRINNNDLPRDLRIKQVFSRKQYNVDLIATYIRNAIIEMKSDRVLDMIDSIDSDMNSTRNTMIAYFYDGHPVVVEPGVTFTGTDTVTGKSCEYICFTDHRSIGKIFTNKKYIYYFKYDRSSGSIMYSDNASEDEFEFVKETLGEALKCPIKGMLCLFELVRGGIKEIVFV